MTCSWIFAVAGTVQVDTPRGDGRDRRKGPEDTT